MDSKILIVLVIIVGIVIVGYSIQEKPPENLEFEYKGYDASNDETGSHIKNVRWENNVLIVEAIVTATCGDPNLKLFGDYNPLARKSSTKTR